MRKTFLFLTLTSLFLKGYAQEKTDIASVSLGAAIPVGTFAATNDRFYNAGYATTGFTFGLNYMHRLNDWIGIAAGFSEGGNTMNSTYLATYTNNSGTTTNTALTVAGNFMGGVFFKPNNFPIYAKAMIGYCVVGISNTAIYDNGNSNNYTFYNNATASGFSYSLGLGGVIPLGRHMAITLSADYLSCNARPTITGSDGQTGSSINTTVNYNETFVNIQAGIGYRFNTGAARNQGYKGSRRGRY